jgi:hypothetical protein
MSFPKGTGGTLLSLFVATRSKDYDLGHDVWHRRKGDLLRPDAYPAKEVKRLRTRQVTPPYELYYQQGGAHRTRLRIK